MRMAVKNVYGAHLEIVEVASTDAAQRWINKWAAPAGSDVDHGLLYSEAEWARTDNAGVPTRIDPIDPHYPGRPASAIFRPLA